MIDRGRRGWIGGALLASALMLAAVPATAQAKAAAAAPIEVVALPNAGSPLVALRLQFDVGSIHDPAGKEGLATLTSMMIGQAGTQKRSYTELVEALYPMAAGVSSDTDREVTVIGGMIHRDKLAEYTALIEEALLKPGFSQEDFQRNKDQLTSAITDSLRANDERLGLELLQQKIFKGHPYGHSPLGTVEGLQHITLDDVKQFYRQHYTQANLMVGVAGGYPADYPSRLTRDLAALPAGQKGRMALPPAPKVQGHNFTLVEKQTGSVGINFGFPLPITRADADYYPLMVANSLLGEHRTFNGRLMNELRANRGLNYGDYSYIEYLANPPFVTTPPPGVAAPRAVLLGLDPAGGAGRRPVRAAGRPLRGPAAARRGGDGGGLQSHPRLRPQLLEALGAEPPRPPRLPDGQPVLRHAVLHRRDPVAAEEADGG